jgi:hypothetical protein
MTGQRHPSSITVRGYPKTSSPASSIPSLLPRRSAKAPVLDWMSSADRPPTPRIHQGAVKPGRRPLSFASRSKDNLLDDLMNLPIIFSIDDDPQVLRAITRDLRSTFSERVPHPQYHLGQGSAGQPAGPEEQIRGRRPFHFRSAHARNGGRGIFAKSPRVLSGCQTSTPDGLFGYRSSHQSHQ